MNKKEIFNKIKAQCLNVDLTLPQAYGAQSYLLPDGVSYAYCYYGNVIKTHNNTFPYNNLFVTFNDDLYNWRGEFMDMFGFDYTSKNPKHEYVPTLTGFIFYLNDTLKLTLEEIKDCLIYFFDCYESVVLE